MLMPSMQTLKVLAPALWPTRSFSLMPGSPAAARSVGSQSWWETMPFNTVPAEKRRHAERSLPVGVLLAAEGGDAGIGPGVEVRTVVGAVHDNGVICNAEVVEF